MGPPAQGPRTPGGRARDRGELPQVLAASATREGPGGLPLRTRPGQTWLGEGLGPH